MRVAIGPSSFGEADPAPIDLLTEHGIEVVPNPFGRRLTEDEIRDHLVDVDGLVAGLEPLNARVLAGARSLKAIARVGVGIENVDLPAAHELGIRVSSTPDAPASAVAELTVGMAITLLRSIPEADAALHDGRWEKQIGRGLSESVVLIVGYGRIGRRVAAMLRPFGPTILVCDPAVHDEPDVTTIDLESGLARADVVTIHAAGSDTILTGRAFEAMKRGTIVLSCGRGGQVDEEALLRGLDASVVGGAWLDVFSSEPYSGPLAGHPRVILTPHMATYTGGTRLEMELEASRNLLNDLELTER